MIPIEHILIFSSLLLSIGIYGALTRRNTIGILMSIELIFNSACLNFVIFTKYLFPQVLSGYVFILFIITVAAAEVAIGLALLINIYRYAGNIDVDHINIMKG